MIRLKCCQTGNVYTALENGDCPECGHYGRELIGHRIIEWWIDTCQSFSECKDHGHPCELPIDHQGNHSCPEANTICMAESILTSAA